jgi:hypothetical protein
MAAMLCGAGRSRLEPDTAPLRGDTPRIVDFRTDNLCVSRNLQDAGKPQRCYG